MTQFLSGGLAIVLTEVFIRAVQRRFAVILTLVAWLLATGAQWDLVQTYGWGRMLVNYSRTMSWTQAVEKTFSGEMCSVCRAVAAAKQQAQENAPAVPGDKYVGKILLLCQPVPRFVFSSPEVRRWSLSDREAFGALRSAPPVPPPRGTAA